MSNNETLKSDPASSVPETTNSEQEDSANSPRMCDAENIVNSRENRNASIHGVDSEISLCTDDGTPELPTKEINITITENVKTPTDAASKQEEKNLENSATCEVKANIQSPNIPEMQQQTSIGAGDTHFIPSRDGNDNVEKTAEEISLISINDQSLSTSDKSIAENKMNTNENLVTISKLQEEVRKTIEERDSYQKKLEGMEKKMMVLQQSYDTLLKGDGDQAILCRMVEQLKGKLIQTSLELEDRIRIVTNQEKQISALSSQVASLKEVESLTRSLLQIRNMEVKHLQAEVDDMEVRINEERDRYNTMINKMDSAVKLNAELKKEYETQLGLFRDLREKYEEKVSLLSEEKRALEANAPPVTE